MPTGKKTSYYLTVCKKCWKCGLIWMAKNWRFLPRLLWEIFEIFDLATLFQVHVGFLFVCLCRGLASRQKQVAP